jgi:hypothetical protein
VTYTVTAAEEVRHTFRIRVRKGQCVNWRTGRKKFHVSNRYPRDPANLNWLN